MYSIYNLYENVNKILKLVNNVSLTFALLLYTHLSTICEHIGMNTSLK